MAQQPIGVHRIIHGDAMIAAAVAVFAYIYMENAGAVYFRKTMFFKYITELFILTQGDAGDAAAAGVFTYIYMECAGRESY